MQAPFMRSSPQWGGYGYYGFTQQNMVSWTKAARAVRAGIRNARVLIVGDSTARGVGSAGGTTNGPNLVAHGWIPQMAPLLKQNASWQSIWGEGNLGNSYPTYDTRVAFGSGWSTGVASTMGGNFFKGGTGTALSFTPLNQCDTFIIGFAISPGSSSFTVNVNGGSTLATQNCTGTNAQGYLTITTTLGSNTLNIVSASTTVYINSIYAYNSTVKEISLFNTGWASAPIANEVNNTGGYTYNPLPGISNSNPDLVIIPQGINDWNLGTAFSAYNSSIQTAINQAKLNGASVILASDNASNTTYAVMAPYIADMKQLAAQNNIPYIDIWNLFGGGSYAVNNTAGLMTDAYHPNATGYGIIAPLYARALNAFM